MFRNVLFGVGAVLISLSVQLSANIYKECGLGAIVFEASFEGVPAAALNVTVSSFTDLGTGSVASEISGTCALGDNEKAAALLILETYPVLVSDVAKGQGNHLSAVAYLLTDSTITESSVTRLQSQFLNSVNRPEYTSLSRLERADALFKMFNNSI